jgi:hypothetical protein
MLAGIEEPFCSEQERACGGEWEADEINEEMTVIAKLLDGLFDYAGLYPPAGLEMQALARNYHNYRHGRHAYALGRLVIDLNRMEESRKVAGECLRKFRLSLIITAPQDLDGLHRLLDEGLKIEAVEIKTETLSEIERIARRLPVEVSTYFEVAVAAGDAKALDAICAAGAQVKLRMGGLVADAFPSPRATAGMLQALADRHLMFKATAGLHHPLRSRHPYTNAPDSAVGVMHGFVNLCCAAALIHFGGDAIDAALILEETDPHAWKLSTETIAWRDFRWTAFQIEEVRQEFLRCVGSCSFTGPLVDLETLGWL